MNRREFLKAVPAVAAMAATASSLAQNPAPPSAAKDPSAPPSPATGPATASGPAIRLAPIELLKPGKDGGKSVLAALWERQTIRNISDKKLPPQMLSDLLWAAFGINREKKAGGGTGRTAASASNSQEIDVYVAMPDGVYLYEAGPHRLTPVYEGDLRAKVGRGRGGAGAKAPVRLIYVVDIAKFAKAPFQEPGLKDPEIQKSYYFTDMGLIAGNVYLFAASQGLAAWFHNCDKAGLARELNLRPDQRVLFGHTVGYPA
ncbi:MAG: nitroreductase family protein [Phycisphaerae bacterium]